MLLIFFDSLSLKMNKIFKKLIKKTKISFYFNALLFYTYTYISPTEKAF